MGEVLENEGGGGEGEVGGEAPTLSGLELKAQACCCCSFTPNNFQKRHIVSKRSNCGV